MSKNRKETILALIIAASIVLSIGIIGYQIKKDYENETSPVIESSMNQELKTYFIDYLNNKYGDNSFRVIQIEKYFSENGIIQKYHTGYKAIVSSQILNNNFYIRMYGTTISELNGAQEDFVESYYCEKLSEYFLQKYNIEFEFDIWLDEEKIPDDCGHIPTLHELTDFNAINDIYASLINSSKYVRYKGIVSDDTIKLIDNDKEIYELNINEYH